MSGHRGDRCVAELVREYERKSATCLNLVASENVMSDLAREMLACDLGHRYCIPPEGERPAEIWEYPNQSVPRQIVESVCARACNIFGGEWADVRPLSGNNAAGVILKALVPNGGAVLSVGARDGGHFTTAVLCADGNITRYDLPYDRSIARVDLDRLRVLAASVHFDLVYLDASMQLFPYPLAAMRDILGPEVPIAYDGSHVLGLIAGGCFQAPLAEGADLVQGSTHKSLFGPQKGIFVARSAEVGRPIGAVITPYFVSNMHVHHVAALGVALEEAEAFGNAYATAVIENAQAFGRHLEQRLGNVAFHEHGCTNCHQVFCLLGSRDQARTGFERLQTVGIHANMVRVPFCDTHGLRFGWSELTRRGAEPEDARAIADIVSDAIEGLRQPHLLAARVRELRSSLAYIQYGFRSLEDQMRHSVPTTRGSLVEAGRGVGDAGLPATAIERGLEKCAT